MKTVEGLGKLQLEINFLFPRYLIATM